MNAILLCRTREVPTPEQVAETLRQSGYAAFVEVENIYPITSVATEIRYAPGRMPIVVKFSNDWQDDPDEANYDYWDWMEELVPDAKMREGIRRFIFVDAMENADIKAFQTVVEYIREQTNAMVTLQLQPSEEKRR